jgi:hypothetical protein
LPQSRESHHRRLALRLSSKNIQPHPSPAQTPVLLAVALAVVATTLARTFG